MASMLVLTVLAMLASAIAYKCPGSGSFARAWSEVTVLASASCADVLDEMKARANGQDHWVDPHNGGIYTVDTTQTTDHELHTKRTTNPKKSVGHKVYTDKQIFTLTPKGTNSCQIDGCSESQGASLADFSTNYCDMRNLYCGTADGCKTVSKDFQSRQTAVHTSSFASSDPSACIVQPAIEV